MKSEASRGAIAVRERPASAEERPRPAEPRGKGRGAIYLHPGQLFASAKPHAIKTILGSCVAVCLWDSVLAIGGVNHYLLPYRVGSGQCSLRFGNVAIEQLLERILALGAAKERLCAKIFGGACVLESFRGGEKHLGSRNVQVARQVLEAHGIPLISEDTGGNHGRKVIFHTDDGSAWVRRL